MTDFIQAQDAVLGTVYFNAKRTTKVVARSLREDGWLTVYNCLTDTEVPVPPEYRLYPADESDQVVLRVADSVQVSSHEESDSDIDPVVERRRAQEPSSDPSKKKVRFKRKDLSSKEAFSAEILQLIRKDEKHTIGSLYDLLEGHFEGDARRKLNNRLVMELSEMLLDGLIEEHEDGTYTLEEVEEKG